MSNHAISKEIKGAFHLIIKIYQTPVEVTATKRTQVSGFLFEPGEKILVIAKVKSKATISGKGYVVYDEMTECPFVVDSSIIEL